MTAAFDPRVVRVGFQVDGITTFFEGVDIRIAGTKFSNVTMNQATIKISNLTRDQRNYILTTATPVQSLSFNQRTPVLVSVDVGRESYTPFRLFQGEVFTSAVLPPPDIGITFNSLTNIAQLGNTDKFSFGAITALSTIAESIAAKNKLTLDFQATDRMIDNYSYTGSINGALQTIQLFGGVRAFVDNATLYVIDSDKARDGEKFILNMNNGMVGVPQATQNGVHAQCLIQPGVLLGGACSIESLINPSVNGDYNISAIGFEIANRDIPFYYNLTLTNQYAPQGTS